MSSAPKRPEKVEKFKGKSGVECETFIQNIRDVAWTEGKLQDGLWMANFASLHYSGKALKWHSDLPLDVRQDWFKQESTLLERWPPPDSDAGDDEVTILPTPAAAPDTATQRDRCCVTAVLAFSHENQNETFYVAYFDQAIDCRLTKDLASALRFRWHSGAEAQTGIVGCWSGSVHKLLAVECDAKAFFPTAGSRSWARLTVVDPATLVPATRKHGSSTRPFRIDVWTVSLQGLVNPAWPDSDGRAATEMVAFSYYDDTLYFAVNQDTFDANHRPEHRGHLMFKPLEQELLRR